MSGDATVSNTRVLVIEDDHNLRHLLEVVLDLEQDIEVETLDDERKAAQVCRRYRPDVVLLDVRLPHLSGERVAADLRSEQPDVRIISMSGFEPANRPWADEQVVKSVTLLEDLHRALGGERKLQRDRSDLG